MSSRWINSARCDLAIIDGEENLLDADAMTRCDLAYEDDERAGEPVYPDPVVPTIGTN
jgi:hypothetical protein